MKVKVASMIAAVFLSGCLANEAGKKPSELSPDELPDTVAFQDEFTLDFMKSTEEVGDGLYWFESGIGMYEMLIPGESAISELSYSTEENNASEMYDIEMEEAILSALYINYHDQESVDIYINTFKSRFGGDENMVTEFEKSEAEDKDVYIAEISLDANEDDVKTYAAFIQNKKDNGSVQLFYQTGCGSSCDATIEDFANSLVFTTGPDDVE